MLMVIVAKAYSFQARTGSLEGVYRSDALPGAPNGTLKGFTCRDLGPEVVLGPPQECLDVASNEFQLNADFVGDRQAKL